MFCSKCGKENKDNASLCVQCSASLGKQESPAPKKSSGSRFWKGFALSIVATVAIYVLMRIVLFYVN